MPHPGEKCLTEFDLFFQGLAEPGPRILPVSVGDRPGEPQRLARLFDRKSSEQVELRQLCGVVVFVTEPRQQLVQRQNEVGILGERTDLIEQLESSPPATPLQPFPIPRMVDQNAPHRCRRGGEEVAPTFKVLVPDQPQVSLVDQGGGVESMVWGLGGHLGGGKFPQFVIDEGEQFRGGLAVSLLN
jgi:hypothetical protein